MNLYEYSGKRIRIITTNGQIFEGIGCDYTPAQDNVPEIESICIGHIEFGENEIKSIAIIE